MLQKLKDTSNVYLMCDTSLKSVYFYSFQYKNKPSKPLQEIRNNYDLLITSIISKRSNFEGDYTYIETSIGIMELLGIKTKLIDLFLYEDERNNLILKKENIQDFDKFIIKMFDFIYNEYKTQLPVNVIKSKMNELFELKKFHKYPFDTLFNIIKDYKKELEIEDENSFFIAELRFQLTWITLSRWMIKKNSGNDFIRSRLIGWSLQHKYKYGFENLQMASVFLDSIKFKDNQEYLDQESIEFLFTGYSYQNKRKPIIFLSADKKKIMERLQEYLGSYFKIPKKLKPPLVPGILILVPEKIEELKESNSLEIISIADFIKTRENPVDAFLRPGMNRVN